MKLMITTQIQENYGAHDWDGVGACPQYWKFKGVAENDYSYFVETDVHRSYARWDPKFLQYWSWSIIQAQFRTGQIECDNEWFP
jgi:hypothetical protein